MKRLVAHPATLLVIAFVAQVVMAYWGAHDEKYHPMGDVIYAYAPWVDYMLQEGKWLGLNAPWVYPFPALMPLLLAKLLSPEDYLFGWLAMAVSLNQLALTWLALRTRGGVKLGWYWLAATLALGPVALSRLDGLSVALAIFALVALATGSIKNSVVWFTLATWIKVWPAAILASTVFNRALRRRTLVAATVTSMAVIAFGFLLGGNANLFSFITQQSARGIQLESVVAMPWVWGAAFGGDSSIYYDTQFLTFQVSGLQVTETAAAMTWWMLLAMSICLALLLVAGWRTRESAQLLALGALLLTLVLIVCNKVGSPQYLGWLIVPVLLGLHAQVPRWWPASAGVLLTTALTQWVYPFSYESLIAAEPWAVVLLTVRNGLEVLLLVWALWRVLGLVFEKQSQ